MLGSRSMFLMYFAWLFFPRLYGMFCCCYCCCVTVLKEWTDEYFVESDHGGRGGAVMLAVDVVKLVGSGLCFGCYCVDVFLKCEALVECYTKEFGMFSGWNWFIVYFDWGKVFLGVFVYSSSDDQLYCFIFVDPGFSTEGCNSVE